VGVVGFFWGVGMGILRCERSSDEVIFASYNGKPNLICIGAMWGLIRVLMAGLGLVSDRAEFALGFPIL
jgi:hypothetical protein